MKRWIYLCLMLIYVVICIAGSVKKTRIPVQEPENLDVVYFDNGVGSYWHDPGDHCADLVVLFPDFTELLENMHNSRRIEGIFKNHHIVYLEYPGVGLSAELLASCHSIPALTDLLHDVYLCILRFKKWKKIIFFGIDYGSIIQSKLYESCVKKRTRTPDHVIQLNGFMSVNTCNMFKIPWFLQLFCNKQEISSHDIYKNRLKNPLIIFHSKNNLNAPFIDSIQLYLKLKNQSVFVPLFGHQDRTLLSKENLYIINQAVQRYIFNDGHVVSLS